MNPAEWSRSHCRRPSDAHCIRETIVIRGLLLALGGTLAGCGGDDDDDIVTCTSELRSAITGDISSPDGLPIDSVTAERAFHDECEGDFSSAAEGSAQGPFEFHCWEQGGSGPYVVRVTSGDRTWTQSATVEEDECHTTRRATLSFVLDPDTAD